jgi:hypothetical protein
MRSRLIGMGSVRILALGVAIPLAAQQGPCDQIAAACKNAGFTLGGASTGTGLQKDCVIPIVQGVAQPAAARRPLPEVDPRLVAACKARRPDVAQGAAPSASAVAVAGGEIVDDGRLGVLAVLGCCGCRMAIWLPRNPLGWRGSVRMGQWTTQRPCGGFRR